MHYQNQRMPKNTE